MKRRKFLQTVALAAPAAVLGSQDKLLAASSVAPARWEAPEPKVFIYDDGRHASGLYQFAPPLTPRDITLHVDQIVESGVDTLFYSAGTEGGVVQYDSKVAAKWGDNVEVWTHQIFYRAARNLRQLIADGHDPMKLMCDRAHEKGIWFLPTISVLITGGDRATDIGLGRKSDFAYNNPQFRVGADDDPRAKSPARFFGPDRFNFVHAEVRQERFRICEELLERYDTDGIELDLSTDNDFGPLCRYSEIPQMAPLLTQWIADLHAVARKAEQAQGRRKRLYVRIPAGPAEAWNVIGFEVPNWVRHKLVDGLVCLTTNRGMLDQDLDLKAVRNLTKGTPCRVLAGMEVTLGRQLASSATPPMIWATAANAYDRGADGVGLAVKMWAPQGWPWTSEEYQTLRLLGHPDQLAGANKIYRARSLAFGRPRAQNIFPVSGPILPHVLREGESVEVPLRIADDLTAMQALQRVSEVRLSVRFTNLEPSLNEIRLELNGQPLPESDLRRIDLHFHVIPAGVANPYGYIYEYLLNPESYPKCGDNRIKVTLVKRDPKLNLPFEVIDVDCRIDYLLHRHFETKPLEY